MRSLRVLAVAAALLVLLAVSLNAAPIQQARSQFGWIVASRLTVNNAADLRDDVTIGDDLTVSGDAQFGGVTGVDPTEVTVVMTGNITPTTSVVHLSAAGNVGTAAVVTSSLSAGAIVHLVNQSNTTITISDTGTLRLSGNAALGLFDSLTLLFDGVNLIELAQGDN